VTLDPNLMGLRLANGICPEFFRYQLEWRRLSRFCENSGVPQLNNKDLYPRPFLRPLPDEQEEIVGVLRAAEEQEDQINNVLLKLERLKLGLMQDLLAVHPRVVGKSAGLPSGFVAKPGGWNKV
jgi:type I restriction enzyme S subunit